MNKREKEAHLLAAEFSAVLHRWLTPTQMRTVIRRNRTNGLLTCASHDFCDANVAMEEAFRLREFSPRRHALWGRAWAIAKAFEFSTNKILSELE